MHGCPLTSQIIKWQCCCARRHGYNKNHGTAQCFTCIVLQEQLCQKIWPHFAELKSVQYTLCWHFHRSMELYICFWNYLVTSVHSPVLRKTQSILRAACLSNFSSPNSLTKTKATSLAACPPARAGRTSCPALWTAGSAGTLCNFWAKMKGADSLQ